MNSIKETFKNKKDFYSKQANLSFEEKIMQLIELQKVNLEQKIRGKKTKTL